MGRPSVDPELMIRMLIIGYCFGIHSVRRRPTLGQSFATQDRGGSSQTPAEATHRRASR
jgi:F0F1-type ATP synthase assembly protein I